MFTINTIDALRNFVGYTVLSAPDCFPREDYLADADQMTLDKAFALLRTGLDLVERDIPGITAECGLARLLEESLEKYRLGNQVKAAHQLQDWRTKILKCYKRRRPPNKSLERTREG
jgi:hypothetical protein